MYLIFDTETTGLPLNYNAPVTDVNNWPHMVQIAWQLHAVDGKLIESGNYLVKPNGKFTIPFNAAKIHGITTEIAQENGHEIEEVLETFRAILDKSAFLIGHNISFDEKIVGAEFFRVFGEKTVMNGKYIDTKNDETTEFCQLAGGRGGKFKWPTLNELHHKLFGEHFSSAHNAAADVEANARVFLECVRRSIIVPTLDISKYPNAPSSYIVKSNFMNLVVFEEDMESGTSTERKPKIKENDLVPNEFPPLEDLTFSHLHLHSQYSVQMGTFAINDIIEAAKKDNQPAVALTDLGNLFASYEFIEKCSTDIKPIIGCECYLVTDRTVRQFTGGAKDKRTQIVFLAKNKNGYKNLSNISTQAYLEGFYYKMPRVDKKLIMQYKEDLICISGGMGGHFRDIILNRGEHAAETELQWWMSQFGEDFYLELNRHKLEEDEHVNDVLLKFAKKYKLKIVATNDVYYQNKTDAAAHDALICIGNGDIISTPIGTGRGTRFGFASNEYYFKSQAEMKALFADLPQAIYHTQEIVDKIERYSLKADKLMLPDFPIPENFESMDDFLRHLTYEGAKSKYPELTPEITERIDFELQTMKNMGFAGYFLIVQDFTTEARNRGVFVGPGRGSAAGSVVAYCLGITNIDPIKYDLLFERFLNPERVSPPDIDIDFDDEGRSEVIDYVVEVYGRESVAQIITYGKLKAKSGIKDAGRVLDVNLGEVNRISKIFPDAPTLDTFKKVLDKEKNPESAKEIAALFEDPDPDIRQMMTFAKTLEGAVRQTGIHAAGVIIAPGAISNFTPLARTKDDGVVTQYDGPTAENAGLLKMDFLGLKTMSILKTCIKLIERNFNKSYNLDDIPLDDAKTFELYQKGLTVGTFQFESPGMQKYLRDLKATSIDDLIAMNALFRPGPLKFIPDYIKRKHGEAEVVYDHEMLEPVLKPTNGIMVYQEQIMRVAQVMGGYSLGQADLLRRAMGKKKVDVMAKEKVRFVEGAAQKGVDKKTAEAVFEKMEYFAGYGFNKSHSAAYSVLAYQTAYFKANYPAEYMAAVLTHNMTNISKVSLFIEECQKIGVVVDPPNINKGEGIFVAIDGRIQYGLAAIKGMGEKVVESLVEERTKNGPFKTIFDVVERLDSRTMGKKTLEVFIQAGAFDTMNPNRRQLLEGLEDIIAYGQRKYEEKAAGQVNLFGAGNAQATGISEPKLPAVDPFLTMDKLNKERELIGFYLSDHPLNRYKEDLKLFCNQQLHPDVIKNWTDRQEVRVGGIIIESKSIRTKAGLPMAFLTLEDLSGSMEVVIVNEVFDKYPGLIQADTLVFMDAEVSNYKGSVKLKARTIERLETVREKREKELMLQLFIRTKTVEDAQLRSLAQLCERNRGEASLRLNVLYNGTDSVLRMNSRNFRVSTNYDMLTEARAILGEGNVVLTRR